MSGSGMRQMAVAAVIAALGTLASAADLSPPSPTRQRPNGALGPLPPPPEADFVPKNWGATSTLDGPPVRFSTDPSKQEQAVRWSRNRDNRWASR
jgi:hypothetical protein